MQCQQCNAILSTLGSLKRHQETSKKCLKLRGLPPKKQKRKLCKRCPNCIEWIDSRSGKSKYDGYCATCFKRVFPDDRFFKSRKI